MEVLIFNSFREFITRFEPDEITIPVSISSPDDGDCMFYHIVIALPMVNRMYECRVYNASTHEISKFRTNSRCKYDLAIGIRKQ